MNMLLSSDREKEAAVLVNVRCKLQKKKKRRGANSQQMDRGAVMAMNCASLATTVCPISRSHSQRY